MGRVGEGAHLPGIEGLAFRVFTQIDVMTKGGPQESTSSLIYYVVQPGFREQRIGYASATTIVFFCFVLLVIIALFLVFQKWFVASIVASGIKE